MSLSSLAQLEALVTSAGQRLLAPKLIAVAVEKAKVLLDTRKKFLDTIHRYQDEIAATKASLKRWEADDKQCSELILRLSKLKKNMSADEFQGAEEIAAKTRQQLANDYDRFQEELRQLDENKVGIESSYRRSCVDYTEAREAVDRVWKDFNPDTSKGLDDETANLLVEADEFMPKVKLRMLAEDFKQGMEDYPRLAPLLKKSQLAVWIGKFRKYQQEFLMIYGLDDDADFRSLFAKLKQVSVQYQPGIIDAFKQDFQTDWSAYIDDAVEDLQALTGDDVI